MDTGGETVIMWDYLDCGILHNQCFSIWKITINGFEQYYRVTNSVEAEIYGVTFGGVSAECIFSDRVRP